MICAELHSKSFLLPQLTMEASHLQTGAIDLLSLRDLGRTLLADLLDATGTNIALVLDNELLGPLDLIAEAGLLKSHGVTEIYTLESAEVSKTKAETVLYLVRPRTSTMKDVAQLIHSNNNLSGGHSVYFCPRKTMLCEHALAELGVYGDVITGEINLELFPCDEDVMSMCLPTAFRELYLEGDPSCLYYVSRALITLQRIYGDFEYLLAKGHFATETAKLMKRMRSDQDDIIEADESISTSKPVKGSAIHNVIILDRTIDLVTPLLTQQVYEGVVDESIGIRNGYIDVKKRDLGIDQDGMKKVFLLSSDSLYTEIRDLGFSILGTFLKDRASYISHVYEERHKAQTVSEMSEFMKKFKKLNREHTSLQNHINLAELISLQSTGTAKYHRQIVHEKQLLQDDTSMAEFIEEFVGKQGPLCNALRLFCLESIVKNGLKRKKLEFLKTEFIQTYGFDLLLTLNNLEKIGLLREYTNRSQWPFLRKSLKLCGTPLENDNHFNMLSTFDGYAPLSIRLVECLSSKGATSLHGPLEALPGPVHSVGSRREPDVQPGSSPVTLVFILGGITRSELSALRKLSETSDHRYVIASTHFITGNSMIEEVVDNFKNATVEK